MADVKTAKVSWLGQELRFQGDLGSGYRFNLGGPPGEQGGSPMEFLLAGVAGCTAMDVVHILRKGRQPVSGLEVSISGVRAEEHPKVYTRVELQYRVYGNGVDPRTVEQAIELSQGTYCSASLMFKQAGVEIETTYEILAG